MMGFAAIFGIVNGTVFPYQEIEPRRYRFRILNGAKFPHHAAGLVEWGEDVVDRGR